MAQSYVFGHTVKCGRYGGTDGYVLLDRANAVSVYHDEHYPVWVGEIVHGQGSRGMSKDYFYLRNGILHRKYTVDEAVKVSKDEEARILGEMSRYPYAKQEVYDKYWSLYVHTMGRQPFAFRQWFDRECEDKRRKRERY